MERRRWLNQSQPQTLVIACFLLYVNAVFAALDVLANGSHYAHASVLRPLLAAGLVRIVGGVLSGYGIANERRWGYYLGILAVAGPLVLEALGHFNIFALNGIGIIVDIALVILLLHPQSRDYEKVWFK